MTSLLAETPRTASHGFRSHVEAILDRADLDPHALVISDQTRSVTAGELREEVQRLARALRGVGLRRGSTLALLADQSIDAVAVRYAAGLIGCASVCCPDHGHSEGLALFLDHVGAEALVVCPGTGRSASELTGPLRLSMGPVPGAVDVRALALGQPNVPLPSRARATDLGVLVTSGGTTGAPKASCRSFGAWRRMLGKAFDPDRRQLVCTPLAYIGQVLLDQTLLGGGSVVLRDPGSPLQILRTIESERITHLGLVEPALVALADSPHLGEHDLSSLVAISHIGADAAPTLRQRLLARLGPVLAHPYGASDAGLVSVLAGPDYDLSRPDLLGTAGTLLPGVSVRIELPDGSLADTYEEGEVVVTSEGVCEGYAPNWSRAGGAGTRTHRTGDIGYLDPNGFLQLRGRRADARVVNGRTVFPVDLQHALCGHPDVRYAVAVPRFEEPDRGGFVALVVADPQSSVRTYELATFVRRQHGDSAVPERIVFCEEIPVTEQGKPDRAVIARLVEGVGTGS